MIEHRKSGFALVELLLAIALFGLISGFLVLIYQKMGDRLFLTATAYDVGLSFRETQSYGVSVKQNAAGGFESGYGLHFETGSATSFVRFADAPVGGQYLYLYDPAEAIGTLRIERGNRIQKFCGILADGNNTEQCTLSFLDVVFVRPNPDAFIRTNKSDTETYKAARIYIASPTGDTRCVEVVNTGQISIKTICP